MHDATGRIHSGSAVLASVIRFGWGLSGLVLAGCFDLDPEPVPLTYGTITDARDSLVYRTVTVQGMTWLQQDLNFPAPGSICPDSTCALRLYSWSTAMGADARFDTTVLGAGSGFRQGTCPQGWHLPTLAEWLKLESVMDSPGLPEDWATNGQSGFGLKGWVQSGDQSLGWYWIAEEAGAGTARIARFHVRYPMYGPVGFIWVEQVAPEQKKSGLGVRCLLDGSK